MDSQIRLRVVKVGNVKAGVGTVRLTPDAVYQGETISTFEVRFTATGPMYGSQIRVVQFPVPLGLQQLLQGDPLVSNNDPRRGSRLCLCQRESCRRLMMSTLTTNNNRQIIVNLNGINRGNVVSIFYQKVKIPDELTSVGGDGNDPGEILVQTITSGNTPVPFDTKGTVGLISGSGKIEITPVSVEIGDTPDFTVKYTAAVAVKGMYIRVDLPENAFKEVYRDSDVRDDALTDRPLTLKTAPTASDGSRNYGYTRPSNSSHETAV